MAAAARRRASPTAGTPLGKRRREGTTSTHARSPDGVLRASRSRSFAGAGIVALRAVCDEEPVLWRRVVNQWRSRPAGGAPSPAGLLASPHLWVRIWAAEALGGGSDPAALERLRSLFLSADEGDRLAAAVGLSWQEEPAALMPLVKGLGASERETRLAAALGLGRLGAPAAIALSRLQVLLETESHPDARQRYREALERIQKAIDGMPAELEAASAPAGLGYELEAANAPAGTGTELVSVDEERAQDGP